MTETSDPPSVRGKSPNLPPPPPSEDKPDSIDVPRLDPPPSSLGAMVQNRAAVRPAETRETSPWLILAFLLVVGLAATIYLYR